ncbi:MAG: SDR family NAD(P)-dependent oxidoreductase [Deltaproteobacteria bacterium]|nr:SDR family NAD(P)-dependent oxidoreductase [Deltaproteobacteria bacterium]
MRILVTGHAGFIGFHLARQLLEQGHQVVGVDNFCEYYPVAIKRGRAALLRQHAGFTEVELDLADRAGVNALLAAQRFDQIAHLAAQAGVRHSLTHPHAYVDANLVGYVNLIEAARQHGAPRFVYASSSSVYGGLTELPFGERQRTDTPISLYAATKRANELIAHSYSHLFGLQCIGLRFFTVYGPWGRPDMALWIFCEKIQAGEPIPVFNRGQMQRDFTYVDDIVAGVRGVIEAAELPRCAIYNIGNNRSERLTDYIALIEQALGQRAEIELLPLQPGDVPATWADISALEQAVGYRPATTIAQGVPRFVAWYLEHPELTAEVRRWRATSPPAR